MTIRKFFLEVYYVLVLMPFYILLAILWIIKKIKLQKAWHGNLNRRIIQSRETIAYSMVLYLAITVLFGGIYFYINQSGGKWQTPGKEYLKGEELPNGTIAIKDTLINTTTISALESFYFSVVTFNTIGFGDYYPKNQFARVTLMIESFIFILFNIVSSAFIASKLLRRPRNIDFSECLLVEYDAEEEYCRVAFRVQNYGQKLMNVDCVLTLEKNNTEVLTSKMFYSQILGDEIFTDINYDLSLNIHKELRRELKDVFEYYHFQSKTEDSEESEKKLTAIGISTETIRRNELLINKESDSRRIIEQLYQNFKNEYELGRKDANSYRKLKNIVSDIKQYSVNRNNDNKSDFNEAQKAVDTLKNDSSISIIEEILKLQQELLKNNANDILLRIVLTGNDKSTGETIFEEKEYSWDSIKFGKFIDRFSMLYVEDLAMNNRLQAYFEIEDKNQLYAKFREFQGNYPIKVEAEAFKPNSFLEGSPIDQHELFVSNDETTFYRGRIAANGVVSKVMEEQNAVIFRYDKWRANSKKYDHRLKHAQWIAHTNFINPDDISIFFHRELAEIGRKRIEAQLVSKAVVEEKDKGKLKELLIDFNSHQVELTKAIKTAKQDIADQMKEGGKYIFSRTFDIKADVPIKSADLYMLVDDECVVFLNGVNLNAYYGIESFGFEGLNYISLMEFINPVENNKMKQENELIFVISNIHSRTVEQTINVYGLRYCIDIEYAYQSKN